MTIIGAIRKLLLPDPQSHVRLETPAVSPAAFPVSRRTFFSFFGAGIVLAAKPDLLLPSVYRFGVSGPNMLTSGLRAEFAAAYEKNYQKLCENQFFYMLMNPPAELLPTVPFAADGAALFSTTPHEVDWNEDRELKRLAGW